MNKDLNEMPSEIIVNGEYFVKKSSIKPASQTGIIKIVILQRGWIYIGRFSRVENDCTLTEASNIRIWGTKKGLCELVNGPTDKTILDKCDGTISFDWLTVVHIIDVNQKCWKGI